MDNTRTYDVAVIGGGLAGLSAALLLARAGWRTVLFEKGHYPAHKVCGEYVSHESWSFLQHLGIPLHELDLPSIDRLVLTAPNGSTFRTGLTMGGFGISRYRLDALLADAARAAGVTLLEGTRVEDVTQSDGFTLQVRSKDGVRETFRTKACCGAWGKKSNLDVQGGRAFLAAQDRRLNNFIGVKYHVETEWPQNAIGLHNFPGGYCGISRVEDDRYCLCYLARAAALRAHGGSLPRLEQEVLSVNPHLKKIFAGSTVLTPFPVTIAQVSFASKARVESGVLMLGDAAGMISPLCGNGMSIALHTGKIAAEGITAFLRGSCTRAAMESEYDRAWRRQFGPRLRRGRLLQRFFGGSAVSNAFVGLFRTVPALAGPVIRSTHGEVF
ncbi:FAD-dependent oxidoreductase [Flaviaesturariibacter amylovorans]|uniref:NAD(P)/FAD-dependent oxidoreductase n=1 Tax=Flaviaesturariibacter amylovorans TaxID=1084520 RepID=A0ABP8G921_9BACT